MFGRHFRGRRFPPHHEHEADETEFEERGGPHGHGWGGRGFPHRRPPFGPWRGDEARWFAPGRRDHFDRFFGRGPFGGGPFGDDPFGEGGPGRRRHRRGDIKYALLELLAEQPRHGYDLIKELEQRYAGFYRPSPGSVYPTLQLLEDEGHLTSEQVEGKRVYTITDSGRALLAEQQAREEEGPGRRWGFRGGAPSPELDALRRNAMSLMASMMEVARHGTPEQVRAVSEMLDATRREIYTILAQERPEDPS